MERAYMQNTWNEDLHSASWNRCLVVMLPIRWTVCNLENRRSHDRNHWACAHANRYSDNLSKDITAEVTVACLGIIACVTRRGLRITSVLVRVVASVSVEKPLTKGL